MLNAKEIQNIIPHRYPFLLVDRVEELIPGERARGYKNVSVNEPFFQGHFPGNPIMPGVLIVEALAQVGAASLLSIKENKGKLGVFTGIDKLRFRRQVVPGDKLELEIEVLKLKRNIGKAKGKATVAGEIAAEGELMFALVDNEQSSE